MRTRRKTVRSMPGSTAAVYQADLANEGRTRSVLFSRMQSILQSRRRGAGSGNLLHRL
jgi:hypothetical protein